MRIFGIWAAGMRVYWLVVERVYIAAGLLSCVFAGLRACGLAGLQACVDVWLLGWLMTCKMVNGLRHGAKRRNIARLKHVEVDS